MVVAVLLIADCLFLFDNVSITLRFIKISTTASMGSIKIHKLTDEGKIRMTILTVIANIKAKADKIEEVKAELLKLIDATREEAGCINYDLHQDNQNPAHFLFYETWQNQSALDKHAATPHFVNFKAATAGLMEELTLNKMTKIG